MDTASTDHDGPRSIWGEITLAHDQEGNVWMGIHPPVEMNMMANGERVRLYNFPMSPDIAIELGQSIIDEAQKVTRLDHPGPHQHIIATQMGGKRVKPVRQAHDHSMLSIEHDSSGRVWFTVVPNDRYKITADGEEAAGIVFPLRPDQATTIGQSFLDEAKAGQADPGAI